MVKKTERRILSEKERFFAQFDAVLTGACVPYDAKTPYTTKRCNRIVNFRGIFLVNAFTLFDAASGVRSTWWLTSFRDLRIINVEIYVLLNFARLCIGGACNFFNYCVRACRFNYYFFVCVKQIDVQILEKVINFHFF